MFKNRYKRQKLIKSIGENGQYRLEASKVAVVGAGGLGSPILYYITAAGVGTIKIIDFDRFEETNLNRQVLHDESRLGEYKAISAYNQLKKLNSEVRIEACLEKLTIQNINNILEGYDLIIDAVDNITTRLILNKFCVKNRVPIIFGAVQEFEGYCYFYDPLTNNSPCYECLFPRSNNHTKQEVPIIGCTAGVIGSWQATEALKYLSMGEHETNLVKIDLLRNQVDRINLLKRADCSVCGGK